MNFDSNLSEGGLNMLAGASFVFLENATSLNGAYPNLFAGGLNILAGASFVLLENTTSLNGSCSSFFFLLFHLVFFFLILHFD